MACMCRLVATIVPRFQFSFFLNQDYCSGRSWLERLSSRLAGLDTNSPMLAKISGTEKKSNWYYGELMAVGLMALSSLWVRKVPGSTPGDARFVVEYDANIVFDLYIIKWKKSTCYTDVWYPFLNFLRNAGLLLINYCMWNFYLMCSTRTRVLVADQFSHFVLGFCWKYWTSLVRISTNNRKTEV